MNKSSKKVAAVLCVAALIALISCKKETVSPASSRDAAKLEGEWKCTWSTDLSDSGIIENAYVGAVWKFEMPMRVDTIHKIGTFLATVDGNTPEGEFGEYHFYDEGIFKLPRLLVWISEPDDFYLFHGYHEDKPGDSFRYTADYSIVLSDKSLILYKYEEAANGLSDLVMYLKFTKVQ